MLASVKLPTSGEINPTKFYALAKRVQSVDEDAKRSIETSLARIKAAHEALAPGQIGLSAACREIQQEAQRFTRREGNPFQPTSDQEFEGRFGAMSQSINGTSFLAMTASMLEAICGLREQLIQSAREIRPVPIVIVGDALEGMPKTFDELQRLALQVQMNEGSINRFLSAVRSACLGTQQACKLVSLVTDMLNHYYSFLTQRHSSQGVHVAEGPIWVDLAITVFENVDSNGEIDHGANPNEVSAFSMRRAAAVIDACRLPIVQELLKNQDSFTTFLSRELNSLLMDAQEVAFAAGLIEKGFQALLDYDRPAISYGDLKVQVRSVEGAASSSHFYEAGVQHTIGVISHHGFSVEGTAKHQVICAGVNGLQWKRLDEVSLGDYIAIPREGLPFGNGDDRADEAYVYGYYVGDGSTGGTAEVPDCLCFSVNGTDFHEFEARSFEVLRRLGNPRAYKVKNSNCVSVQVLRMSKDAVLAYRTECGHYSENKRVPPWVLSAGKNTWKSFLQGYFDSDGSAFGQHVEVSSNSRDLLRTVQLMLLGFGVISRVVNKLSNIKSWRLTIYGENIRKFAQAVGFTHTRKLAKLTSSEGALTRQRNDNLDVVPITKEMWRNVKTATGELPRAVHKMIDGYWRGKMPSRVTLEKLLRPFRDSESKQAIRALSTEDYFWDKVTVVADTGAKPVYDLVVPGVQSFAANGFMNHNTQVLRGLGAATDSIGVFAQASDFLTCWKGESEKNPKRLFEGGLKVQKESGKQVFFLIDEIDTILNGEHGQAAFGGVNLATEFQVLMDGIMTYNNLALWGATNYPDRIPMAILRRFAKVLVVGELDQDDRVKLLKYFGSFLPLAEDFPEAAWQDAAKRLEGGVGDLMRKVVDEVWREKMGDFTTKVPGAAESLVKMLNGSSRFDVKDFDETKRRRFLAHLRPYVQMRPKDLLDSVENHLNNIAVRCEIEEAKRIYEVSRRMLAGFSAAAEPNVEPAKETDA